MASNENITAIRLTGFGKRFAAGGVLRGYGYVRGGATGYTTRPAKEGPALSALRAALLAGDKVAIEAAAKKLPSVEISRGMNGREWHLGYKGALLADEVK